MSIDGRRARWEGHTDERRRAVLEAAIAILERDSDSELHLQQIADEAGLSRTVIYRYFADRAELDSAIQQEILDRLLAAISSNINLDGTPLEIAGRLVTSYVGWADEHPHLHRFAERGTDQVAQTTVEVGSLVTILILSGAELMSIELTTVEREALPLVVSGIIALMQTTVQRWLLLPERAPSAAELSDLLARTILYSVVGHVEAKGIKIELDQPLPI